MSADPVGSPESVTATDPRRADRLGLAAGRWELVPADSAATFAVRNWGLMTVHGSVPVLRGHVTLGAAGTVDQVHAELALDGLDTHNARRDGDLAKPSLLDLARFPALRFDGRSEETASSAMTLTGTVSAHGETAPVTLAVRVDPPVNGRVTVRASTEFDRRDLGIHAPRLLIGWRVRVEISACFELR